MKKHSTTTKSIALVGICASVALLLSYVEFLLPPIFAAVPGIKLGLPNVVILYVLYCVDFKSAALVSFVRIALSSLLFGNPLTLAYSVAGAVLSLAVMVALKSTKLFSTIGVSVCGAVMHNLGQIIVAALVLDTPKIAYYMVILTVTGTLAGVFIGLCGAHLINRLPKDKITKR